MRVAVLMFLSPVNIAGISELGYSLFSLAISIDGILDLADVSLDAESLVCLASSNSSSVISPDSASDASESVDFGVSVLVELSPSDDV